ncbi:class I SAM-dependent methyltransferase [Paenibacillus sp. 1001270B_150601_E10]|uniref:class I SAM-dependent methyltransferase n=1 Tax=Paenibacillus sp. 1001270B_150601_E10 TaxID=2787079 RepID=UPI00189F41B4|nr:class I SAM-dependent methyltransferase [Paenibacillus sp. 1001270B_150601_E10]
MKFFWNDIIHPILQAIKPHSIIEIGCAQGYNTMHLLELAHSLRGKLTVIDPSPQFDTEQVQQVYGSTIEILRDYSLNRLPHIAQADVVLVDGDHNWYTVYHELKFIERMERFPVVFLHDTEWPYARRDMYYFPESVPAEFRQPNERKGMLPGVNELVAGGHNESVWNAAHEYGPRNGVLTAVEDFLRESPRPLRLHHVPKQHGLSIIASNVSVIDQWVNQVIEHTIARSTL